MCNHQASKEPTPLLRNSTFSLLESWVLVQVLEPCDGKTELSLFTLMRDAQAGRPLVPPGAYSPDSITFRSYEHASLILK